MKKQILYILLFLPAIILFEKGFCQNKQSDIKVLSLEKNMDINGKLQVRKRILSEHQRVKINLNDNSKIIGRIYHITDSTISVGRKKDINISTIKKICRQRGPLLASGGSLIVVSLAILIYSSAYIGLPYLATGLFTFFIGGGLTFIGFIDQATKIHYSMDKGWKINVISAPPRSNSIFL